MLYHNVLLPHKKNITEPWKTRQQPQTSHTNPITHLYLVLVLSSLSLVTIYSILTRTHQSSGWAESVWCPFWWSRSCWGPTASRSWTTPPWRAQARRGWCRQPGQKKMWWKIIFIWRKELCTHLNLLPVLGVDKHLLRLNIRLVKHIKLDLIIKGFSFKF